MEEKIRNQRREYIDRASIPNAALKLNKKQRGILQKRTLVCYEYKEKIHPNWYFTREKKSTD